MTKKINHSNSTHFTASGHGRSLIAGLTEITNYLDLLLLFTHRDLVAEFKQTLLGPAWIFIKPLFTTLAYAIVFGGIAKLSTDGVPHILFYLLGVTFWDLFASTFSSVSNLFVANHHIFSKVYFPRLVSILSTVLSKSIVFGIQLLTFGLVCIFIYSDTILSRINPAAFLLPLVILTIILLGAGIGLLIAASTVRYRDFRKSIGFLTQIMLFSTPVMYSSGDVPQSIERILIFNPLVAQFDALRWGFFDAEPVKLTAMAYSVIVTILILIIGIISFHRAEQNFIDEI